MFDTADADPLGNNPIYKDGKLIGRATSGNFGPRLSKSIALAMLTPEISEIGNELDMDILGKMHKVQIIEESPYDPRNERVQA